MSDLVSIASGAVSIYQRALATVSNNIANVDTEGYVRQELDQKENNTRQYGTSYFGTGAYLAGVERQYDQFIESNVRNSFSDLETQSSLVGYANRIVDVLGDEKVGLLGAFDKFFASARALSTDPASNILRSTFLADSDGLAAQFRTLSSQLELIDNETSESLTTEVKKINSIVDQLRVVNKQLSRHSKSSDQPPELMDKRDLLLRDLSQIVKIKVFESGTGEVTVSLGATKEQGVVLEGVKARPLSANLQDTHAGDAIFTIDANTKTEETASGLGGGSLGGLIELRSQVLGTVFDELDALAKSFATQVNSIHKEGLDGYGRKGGDLFAIDPKITFLPTTGVTSVKTTATIDDLSKLKYGDIKLGYDASLGQVNTFKYASGGNFSDGDKVYFSLNGSTATYTVESGAGSDKAKFMASVTRFLQDAFGTQITVTAGGESDVNISSRILKDFQMTYTTNSTTGKLISNVQKGLWTAVDDAGTTATGTDKITINGLEISLVGAARDGESITLKLEDRPAASLKVVPTDPQKIAAASQFRVLENALNVGKAIASIGYEKPAGIPGAVKSINNLLDSNPHTTAGIVIDGTATLPLLHVPAGSKSIALHMQNTGADPLELQIMTTDGRHLVGKTLGDDAVAAAKLVAAKEGRALTQTEIDALVQEAGQTVLDKAGVAGGFEKGATYSSDYLSTGLNAKYKDFNVFYGARATSGTSPQYDIQNHLLIGNDPVSASLRFGAITPDSDGLILADGALNLNGESLGPLTKFAVNSGPPTGYTIDENATFFNAGDHKIRAYDEGGTLKYQFIFPGGTVNGTLTTDASGVKTLSFPAIAGKHTGFKISFNNSLSDGDTVAFTTAALSGDNLTNHVVSWLDRQQDSYGNKLLASQGITATVVDGDPSTAAIESRIQLIRSVQAKAAQITQSGVFSASSSAINGGNAFNLNITTVGIVHKIAIPSGKTTPAGVVEAINASNIGISAVFDADTKKIKLTGTKGKENAFTITVTKASDNTTVSDLSFSSTQTATSGTGSVVLPSDISFGFGEKGTSADLTRLGLRTTAYIDGDIKENLLLFATGKGTGRLNAEYESIKNFDAVKELRSSPFEISFVTESTYKITDTKTGTVVAERKYDAAEGIQYQGVKVELNPSPMKGDSFIIDGDEDGIANNQNIQRILNLETKRFIGGGIGATLSETYGSTVTKVGNVARKATIAEQALTIVRDQALESRDQISGVSLDQEAADLVRFQQAYQASARVMQVANQLFDAILQVQ